jgi:hypothetical protein
LYYSENKSKIYLFILSCKINHSWFDDEFALFRKCLAAPGDCQHLSLHAGWGGVFWVLPLWSGKWLLDMRNMWGLYVACRAAGIHV